MAVLKCKMCGGTLDVTEGMTVCECEYCGTQQTITTAGGVCSPAGTGYE